jgi:anti-anti-sigma regulatory factor
MLIINQRESKNGITTLRLEGRVIGRWVEELSKLCERILNGNKGLALDLSGVLYIDDHAVTLFRALQTRHVTLLNPSPFVKEQLKGGTGLWLPTQ